MVKFFALPWIDTFSLKLSDRFGDYGLVGMIIIKYADRSCIIDTFLMSCRVLGRGVEDILLGFVSDFLLEKDYEQLVGLYRPTPKNKQVKLFFSERGFLYEEKEFDYLRYKIDIRALKFDRPDYFKKIKIL